MTADRVLVFNAGSATLKYALFGPVVAHEPGGCVARGQLELPTGSRDEAVRGGIAQIVRDVGEFAAAGHRIVHGGPLYTRCVAIDARVLADLAALQSLAPLHQGHGLAVITALREAQPTLPQFASFDTAFHSTMPNVATRFALPQVWFDRGIRRYGFHGLSYEYIACKLQELSAAQSLSMNRVVVAHLGSGASLCALRGGTSIATTMSFTPTDGLMMATRSGALDPSIVTYLMREFAMNAAQVDHLLNYEAGLLGVSGVSGDMRDLLVSVDPHARLAVDLFVYRIVVEMGAMIAALGGVDALVFTGGIGTHQAIVRERVSTAFTWLGVECDRARNDAGETRFDADRSRVALWNIPTDEEFVIARHTAQLFAQRTAT